MGGENGKHPRKSRSNLEKQQSKVTKNGKEANIEIQTQDTGNTTKKNYVRHGPFWGVQRHHTKSKSEGK